MGESVEVVEPERGRSVRGTSDDTRFSGDVGRQLLVQMAQPADLSQPARRPPPEPRVAVTVRERASRRAGKPRVDAAEAAARAHQVAEPLVGWDNQQGGGVEAAVRPPGPGETDAPPGYDRRGGGLRDRDVCV